ncbi:bifunctional adenosylcobinamide kinase/adenosylcobinamide-phosphate guanylyltransferase [Alkalihalobacillus oceani]|uniref:bifunctional adenosylcobinamide kinase/adenosylcobinamide-phosphate guanylyltransferase n=1 Tax=Halalkalibacter oceani TaxID=1653776 RepID=UPI00203FC548|nr:bifunctional adenosylcobinamide kinase/adenosylcobinamide-phosphate guanylyltransferase [Halalkalibacter oceani]
MISFITGGVRSGKSRYAEQRAIELASRRTDCRLHYFATSAVYDREMEQRVNIHQQQRQASGQNWHVWEQERNLHTLLAQVDKQEVILLDCVTTLVSNELFYGWERGEEHWRNADYQRKVVAKLTALFNRLAADYQAVIVSNEVTSDLPAADEGTVIYQRLLGQLHCRLVALADEAIEFECGLPCWKKGGKGC